jgi:hypothetical protein
MAIEASHYSEDRDAMRADPIVQRMAEEVPDADRSRFLDSEGHPNWQFMSRANATYSMRGGKVGGHIGCVAEAIVELWKEK